MPARRKATSSQSIEDYLKATYKIQREGKWASTSALAEQLHLTPSSVTNMVQRLEKMGYLLYTPYRGFHLTAKGKRKALGIIRHHRLLELFLMQVLGYTWDRVHEEAERLEHAISEDFVQRVDRLLGYPKHDPHGDPIPSGKGKVGEKEYRNLSECAPGALVVVTRVSDNSAEFLRYAASLELFPGTPVDILGRAPFHGPVQVRVNGREHYLGWEAASRISVERAGKPTEWGSRK